MPGEYISSKHQRQNCHHYRLPVCCFPQYSKALSVTCDCHCAYSGRPYGCEREHAGGGAEAGRALVAWHEWRLLTPHLWEVQQTLVRGQGF